MRLAMRLILMSTLVAALAVGSPLLVPAPPADGTAAAAGSNPAMRANGSTVRHASAAGATTQVMVVSANVREGSRARRSRDLRDGDDLESFTRRVFARDAKVPDVVLLQEVRGSASAAVQVLNQHPSARRSSARYVVAVEPSRRPGDGRCDGPRKKRHEILRDSAIVVNSATVSKVHQSGVVRTWGNWFGEHGCAEQPWALITVRDGNAAPRLARVASAHIAPSRIMLKSRAIVRTAHALERQNRRTPSALLALGGDLNLTRCQGAPRTPETAGCRVRLAHRYLLDQGFVDAVRSRHLRGADGVVGVQRRIDFLYTTDQVRGSWFDRCYRAFDVAAYPCDPAEVRFANVKRIRRCQHQVTVVGRPGGKCSIDRGYPRYYSDHPIVRALLS